MALAGDPGVELSLLSPCSKRGQQSSWFHTVRVRQRYSPGCYLGAALRFPQALQVPLLNLK